MLEKQTSSLISLFTLSPTIINTRNLTLTPLPFHASMAKTTRTVSRPGACASYDVPHSILLFINHALNQIQFFLPKKQKRYFNAWTEVGKIQTEFR